MLQERSKPMQSNGILFQGLLSINEAGVITSIDVIVGNNVFTIGTDPDWIRNNFPFTYNDTLRWREMIKQAYKDKISKELL